MYPPTHPATSYTYVYIAMCIPHVDKQVSANVRETDQKVTQRTGSFTISVWNNLQSHH